MSFYEVEMKGQGTGQSVWQCCLGWLGGRRGQVSLGSVQLARPDLSQAQAKVKGSN